jgi:hypothetical protein
MVNLCVKVARELILGVILKKSSDKFSEKKCYACKFYVVKSYAKKYLLRI